MERTSMNKILLLGIIGREPDVQRTMDERTVAHVSLATSRRVKIEDGRGPHYEQRTEWHRLTLWDDLARAAAEHVHKGDRVYVEGRMEYDSYEKNGVTIPTAEVIVHKLVRVPPGGEIIITERPA